MPLAGEKIPGGAEDAEPLLGPVLDALPAQIALLDAAGVIVAVNRAWRRFAVASRSGWTSCGVGSDYLAICKGVRGEDGPAACAMAEGIRAVVGGKRAEFSAAYRYTTRGEVRHFLARVTRCESSGRARAVVTHEDVTERRQAEEALSASEARFRSLIDNALDVITIVDAEGVIRYESPSAERVVGYPAPERIGRSFFDLIHADDLPRVIAEIARTLERPERNVTLEYRFRRGDGAWRIMEGTARNLLAEPAVGGIVLNCREVTERKRAEEAQARLAAVMDWTPNFVCVADPHGRLLYANTATRRLMGLGEEGLPDQFNLTDLHPQWVSDLLLHEGIPTAVREGVWSGETALLDANGNEVPVLQAILAHRSGDRGVEYFSTISHDITERKRSEEALRESDEIFRQIAENISETLWIFDLDQGRPIYISPGYERIWDRPVESAYADPSAFLASVAPADRRRVSSPTNAKRSRGRDEEFQIQQSDGSPRWLRGRSFPIHDARGSVTRIVGLTEDITDRKRMESELRQAQRLEAIGHLAAGVAHEINTPIQYVGDNIRFLQEGFDELSQLVARHQAVLATLEAEDVRPDLVAALNQETAELDLDYLLEEVPRAVLQSLEGVERVAEIVRAMKEFSHPGSTERVPLDLNRTIQSTLTVARSEWKYVAELVTEFDPQLPPVPCFPGEFNQALLNIIINAAHAIADEVGGGTGEPGTLSVRTRRVESGVEIEVEDTGCGIPEEVRARVFDPFFTTKEVGRGTGQGLTLAHSVIVDKHGGSLHFETEVGRGTTFVIRLPLQVEDSEPGGEPV
ncbi:MAG TPA: PAS domain S-box protein [Longimicrobiaceae bacterium]|nr:PAS domain S-box protein [Longimicrobiaceae bacterium]